MAHWQRKILRDRRANRQSYDIPPSDRLAWLYLAIMDGLSEEASHLITSGVDVDALHKLGEGVWCLEWAADGGLLDVVELLVEFGADVNHASKDGPALMCAVTAGHLAVYDYLKRRTNRRHQVLAARRVGEATRSPDEQERVERFLDVCERGLVPTIHRLIAQGFDINARCEMFDGCTPLALAARGRSLPFGAKDVYTEIVELLLASGADPNLESYEGETPLVRVGNAEICRKLLAAGADARAVDDLGGNVLMRLASAECCRLLLEAGASAEVVDRRGCGTLEYVAWWAQTRQEMSRFKTVIDARYDRNLAEIFRLLIAAGAKLDPPTEDEPTALDFIADLKVPEALKVLSAAPVWPAKRRKRRR